MNLGAIPRFDGYSVDADSGLIFSHKTNKFLKMDPNRVGYGRTCLFHDGKKKYVFNHIKCVEVHGDKYGNTIPPFATTLRELGLSIDHLDEDKMNPSRDNLELILHSENVKRIFNRVDCTNECAIPDL